MDIPKYLNNYLVLRSSLREKFLRDQTLIDIPRVNTSLGQTMFKVAAAHDWNLLPKCIRDIKVLGSFKNNAFKHFLELDKSTHRSEASANCLYSSVSGTGLSSVLHRNIHTYYPDAGADRYKLFFNRLVQPHQNPQKGLDDIHILFCNEDIIKPGEAFQPNHFVPLLFHSHKHKHKSSADSQVSTVTKKQKMAPIFPKQPITKKQKLTPILPKKASNKADANMLNFFTIADKPTVVVNPACQKAPNATSTQLDAHKLDEIATPSSTSQHSSTKTQQSTTSVPAPNMVQNFPRVKHDFTPNFDVALYREKVKDGGYCLSCVLFGDRFPGKSGKAGKIQKLFSEHLTYWNNATFTFKRHAGHGGEMGLYAFTFPILTSLLAQMSGTAQPIEVIVDTNRDGAKYHQEVGSYSTGGVGNFVESLNFRVRAGDKILEDHLKTCGKNRSYISKTSQNKIINCCGEVISEKIINDIKESKFIIIAGEAADSSHRKQMSLVLCFVDTDMNIREEFIAFLHCKWALSGAALAKLVLEALNDLTLSIEDCREKG
ncbi:Hypothetical predicted protein [Paramuricea clavata]|uniref:DUF4371 domain-containing protein n=1 Tax=Paramuricea clavata TaxID=317549 RepID=A0A7D9I0C5_PARCT|nr:Hypothetical predicted protein [Paramuricea clavata]